MKLKNFAQLLLAAASAVAVFGLIQNIFTADEGIAMAVVLTAGFILNSFMSDDL